MRDRKGKIFVSIVLVLATLLLPLSGCRPEPIGTIPLIVATDAFLSYGDMFLLYRDPQPLAPIVLNGVIPTSMKVSDKAYATLDFYAYDSASQCAKGEAEWKGKAPSDGRIRRTFRKLNLFLVVTIESTKDVADAFFKKAKSVMDRLVVVDPSRWLDFAASDVLSLRIEDFPPFFDAIDITDGAAIHNVIEFLAALHPTQTHDGPEETSYGGGYNLTFSFKGGTARTIELAGNRNLIESGRFHFDITYAEATAFDDILGGLLEARDAASGLNILSGRLFRLYSTEGQPSATLFGLVTAGHDKPDYSCLVETKGAKIFDRTGSGRLYLMDGDPVDVFFAGDASATEIAPTSIYIQSPAASPTGTVEPSPTAGAGNIEKAAEAYIAAVLLDMKYKRFDQIGIMQGTYLENPVFNNMNGYGLAGIDTSYKAYYTNAELLAIINRYVRNVFGDDAWANAAFTYEATAGPDSQYVDVNGEKVLQNDPRQFLVHLSFDGYTYAPTGEGNFRFVIRMDATPGLYQSFNWDEESAAKSDQYPDVGTKSLTDNLAEQDAGLQEAIASYLALLSSDDVDGIVARSKELLPWDPAPDASGIGRTRPAIVADQLATYRSDAKTNARTGIFCMKIACIDHDGRRKDIWVDRVTRVIVDAAVANAENDAWLKIKCEQAGIDYEKVRAGKVDQAMSEIMYKNDISQQYYPYVQSAIFVDAYDLYKVVLLDDRPNSTGRKYYDFYMSNEGGTFRPVSALYFEPIATCGIGDRPEYD